MSIRAVACIFAGAVLSIGLIPSDVGKGLGPGAAVSQQKDFAKSANQTKAKEDSLSPDLIAQILPTAITASCPAGELEDSDGDFSRNAAALSSELCFYQVSFTEGKLRWVFQIIKNVANPSSVLWFVPHDDEDAAFDSAVYAVRKFGGTVVAVDNRGERNNGKQDPNRNFDLGAEKKCAEQVARSPKYTAELLKFWNSGMPIIALHTNMGGNSTISILKPEANNAVAFVAPNPIAAKSPNNTLVFIASQMRPEANPDLTAYAQTLNASGVHVLYEVVSLEATNCSLSHYAALRNFNAYTNIEVVDGDGQTQRMMIDRVMKIIQK